MKTITNLNEIDLGSKEGKLLFAAIAKITSESQTDKTPDEVIQQLNDLSDKIQSNGGTHVAYEFHNHTTGHCYVDYIQHGNDEKEGYIKTPLYK
jgi:hypothetical protein